MSATSSARLSSDLGEHAKIAVFSVAQGEDKPVKCPHMFGAASLVILNKIDLLPHLDFDVDRALANVRAVNPGAAVLPVSARTGEGAAGCYEWLWRQIVEARETAFG